MRLFWITLLSSAFWVATTRTQACPFCNASGTTLTKHADTASMIVFGTLKNPRLDPKEYGQGATDLEIEVVIKSHPYLNGRTTITLPRYIPTDEKQPGKYLVFCDVLKDNRLDPYQGTPFKPDSRIADYLKGALAIKEKDVSTRLRFFFDYLADTDTNIALDAFQEFGTATYQEFRATAEKLPAERIVKWLRDPGTPPSRFGLYGSMLGHCGKPADAEVLRAIIDDPTRRRQMGNDGILAGLVMLTPKDGWARIGAIMADPKEHFEYRYSALKAAQFLWDYRSDIIGRDEIAETVTGMLKNSDLADLAIESLSRWKYWKAADRVMALASQPDMNSSLIRRSLLRFALRCPAAASPAASEYVIQQRKKSPEAVKDAESFLATEMAIPPAGK